jgi:hypothetical protein
MVRTERGRTGLPPQHRLRAAHQAVRIAAARGAGPLQPRSPHGRTRPGGSRQPGPRTDSTSYVERQNLTMRLGIRRFTRLTNGFSKKLDNHMAAIALHFLHYNFARPHKTLAYPYPRTPAMAAGISDHVWTLKEIAALLD